MTTQQVDSPLTDVSSSEAPIEQVLIYKCGSASGILYLDKFNGRGSQKCILSESVWYSSKNWRKSLLLESSGVLLGTYLSSIGFVTSKSGTASPSPARQVSCRFPLPLIDPGLAFKLTDLKVMYLVSSRPFLLVLILPHLALLISCYETLVKTLSNLVCPSVQREVLKTSG